MHKIALYGAFNEDMRISFQEVLPEGFELVFIPTTDESDKLQDVDYIVIRTVSIREETIKTLRRTKFIQRWGVGYDIIDIKAAGEKNIPVAVMVGINSIQVAELAVAHILALYRNLIPMHNGLLAGKWLKAEFMKTSYTVSGKKVGIVGLGNIGSKVAERLKAFGADVQYFDTVRKTEEQEQALGVQYVSYEELLKTSDIVTLHVPLKDDTRGLINKDRIKLMKPTAIIVNTSRGGVVNEADLFEALNSGKLLGAGLDVYEEEPLKKENPLCSLKNVVLSPHVGGNTIDNNLSMAMRAIENIVKVSKGESAYPTDLVNTQYLNK